MYKYDFMIILDPLFRLISIIHIVTTGFPDVYKAFGYLNWTYLLSLIKTLELCLQMKLYISTICQLYANYSIVSDIVKIISGQNLIWRELSTTQSVRYLVIHILDTTVLRHILSFLSFFYSPSPSQLSDQKHEPQESRKK